MAQQIRVFVSHHHSEEEDAFTARLVADLEAAGADVWVDDVRITSDDFIKKINEGLAGRQWLVLVMTPDALRSPWVQAEVNAALHQVRGGRMLGVVPIVAMECDEGSIPPLWATLHRYNATRAYEPARDGLLRAVGLGGSATLAVSPSRHFPLPDVPMRLTSLGFRGTNPNGTPAIVPPLVSVAAGPFLMGSASSDQEAHEDELPQHSVELPAFQIGKYPVTVAEYSLAVRTEAVREPPAAGSVTWQTQLQHADHPVVCISWQDAMDYLAWLREATGQAGWGLPSEAQWEKAARWDATRGVSRIYPWGDTFDQNRCNTSESGIKTTTPVGSYPASDARRSGTSPCGAEDMAGNVWEWTSSVFKPYPYAPRDGREHQHSTKRRTLRGGSWSNVAKHVRTTYRNHVGWDALDLNKGVRLALSGRASS